MIRSKELSDCVARFCDISHRNNISTGCYPHNASRYRERASYVGNYEAWNESTPAEASSQSQLEIKKRKKRVRHPDALGYETEDRPRDALLKCKLRWLLVYLRQFNAEGLEKLLESNFDPWHLPMESKSLQLSKMLKHVQNEKEKSREEQLHFGMATSQLHGYFTRGVARSAPNASEADEVHKQDEVHMYERETSKGTKGKCTSRRFGVWCKNLAEMDELPSRWYTTSKP
ncbi:hypothetical protein V8E54_013327 [Elaphomyces granulatus]